MIDRFKGDAGRTRLVEALLQQEVVANEREIAERLAASGELLEFTAGSTMIEQGGADDDVYLLICGRTEVLQQGHLVAKRECGTSVGEMAAIQPASPRSATIRAATEVVALKLSSTAFREAGGESWRFWERLAVIAARRLSERARFHLPANIIPILFIGSSRESLPVAETVNRALHGASIDVRLWSEGIFGPSSITIEALLEQIEAADFALFVFGPDDKIQSRDRDHIGPRDNVVFEMGLFLGRLGRERVFMLQDEGLELKIPSDLTGVLPIKYKQLADAALSDCLTSSCDQLRATVAAKGPLANRMRV